MTDWALLEDPGAGSVVVDALAFVEGVVVAVSLDAFVFTPDDDDGVEDGMDRAVANVERGRCGRLLPNADAARRGECALPARTAVYGVAKPAVVVVVDAVSTAFPVSAAVEEGTK